MPLAVGTADQALDVLVTVRLDPLGGAVRAGGVGKRRGIGRVRCHSRRRVHARGAHRRRIDWGRRDGAGAGRWRGDRGAAYGRWHGGLGAGSAGGGHEGQDNERTLHEGASSLCLGYRRERSGGVGRCVPRNFGFATLARRRASVGTNNETNKLGKRLCTTTSSW